MSTLARTSDDQSLCGACRMDSRVSGSSLMSRQKGRREREAPCAKPSLKVVPSARTKSFFAQDALRVAQVPATQNESSSGGRIGAHSTANSWLCIARIRGELVRSAGWFLRSTGSLKLQYTGPAGTHAYAVTETPCASL